MFEKVKHMFHFIAPLVIVYSSWFIWILLSIDYCYGYFNITLENSYLFLTLSFLAFASFLLLTTKPRFVFIVVLFIAIIVFLTSMSREALSILRRVQVTFFFYGINFCSVQYFSYNYILKSLSWYPMEREE
ncbi:hypothetical protein ENFAE_25850 [Enterococcus faecalis]|nr:hypothetical protein ENFAE_25850 [Enterococcus faecalis]